MQQRTSVLPPAHPVRALVGLARQIALPHEHAPERFPSFPALERTALMGFNAPATLALPASTPVKVMLSRQAAYPAWAEQSYSGAAWASTWVYDNIQFTTATPSATAVNPIFGSWAVANRAATVNTVGLSGITTQITPYAPLGVDAGSGSVPYVWVPSNWSMLVVISGNSGFSNLTVATLTLELWSAPGETGTYAVSANIGAGNYSIGVAGPSTAASGYWVRPRSITFSETAAAINIVPYVTIITAAGTIAHTPSGATQGTATITPAAVVGFVPLVYPTEFTNSSLPWLSTRTTASALLGTNVTQVLNKGGTVLAGRIAPQVVNPFSVQSTYINALHPAEKAFLPLETGVYTYAPPSTDLADFWDYVVVGGTAPVYRLDNVSLVNVMYLTASSVAESLAVNVDWHVEFRTSSALFQIGLSAVTLETLHQAQVALATVGFFFENPQHSKILNAVVSAAKKYAPTALGMVHPVAGQVGRAAVKILSSKPNSKMKATSATASGMVRKDKPKPKPKAVKKKK